MKPNDAVDGDDTNSGYFDDDGDGDGDDDDDDDFKEFSVLLSIEKVSVVNRGSCRL